LFASPPTSSALPHSPANISLHAPQSASSSSAPTAPTKTKELKYSEYKKIAEKQEHVQIIRTLPENFIYKLAAYYARNYYLCELRITRDHNYVFDKVNFKKKYNDYVTHIGEGQHGNIVIFSIEDEFCPGLRQDPSSGEARMTKESILAANMYYVYGVPNSDVVHPLTFEALTWKKLSDGPSSL
jgi:hypothetical protein